MKMVAACHLVACAAWSILAVAQVATPPQAFGSDVAKTLPVPSGWHVVAFTSPKAAASANPSPEQTVLDGLNAQSEAEEEAKAAKGPPEDNMLAEALGSTPEAQPSTSATSAAAPSTESTDGLQIPAGYRVEGLTPGAALATQPTPKVTLAEAAKPESNDGLQIPAGYRIEGLTPGAQPEAPPAAPQAQLSPAVQPPAPVSPAAALPLVAPAAATPKAAAPAAELKVDGLQVPAGWKITSIIDDAPAPAAIIDAAPAPPATSVQKDAAKPPQPPLQSAAVKEQHKPAAAASTAPQVDTAPKPLASKPKVLEAAPVPTALAASSWEKALAASNVITPSKPEAKTAIAVEVPPAPLEAQPVDGTPGVLDGDVGVSVLEPVGAGSATAASGEPTLVNTAEVAVDKMLNFVHPEQAAAPFVSSEALEHITSVECLTETIDNGGRPCKTEYEKAMEAKAQAQKVAAQPVLKKPELPQAVRRTLLTKGTAHRQQSVTMVLPHPVKAVGEAPPRLRAHHEHHFTKVVQPRLRAHHQDHVTQVPMQVVHHEHRDAVKVVHHEHQYHRQQEIPVHSEEIVQRGSMADLVSKRSSA